MAQFVLAGTDDTVHRIQIVNDIAQFSPLPVFPDELIEQIAQHAQQPMQTKQIAH